MSVISDFEFDEENIKEPSIYLHDLSEITNPAVKTKDIWSREFKCPIDDFSDPHIALNTTSLFAVAKNKDVGSKIHVWNFWNYDNDNEWKNIKYNCKQKFNYKIIFV